MHIILNEENAVDLAQYLSEWLTELECPISADVFEPMLKKYIVADNMADAEFQAMLDTEYEPNHEPDAYL